MKNQASSILSKLGVRDRTRAVLRALEIGRGAEQQLTRAWTLIDGLMGIARRGGHALADFVRAQEEQEVGF